MLGTQQERRRWQGKRDQRNLPASGGLQAPSQQTPLAPRRGARPERPPSPWAGEGKPSPGAPPPGTQCSRDTGVHLPCIMLRAARRSERISSPPRVEGQTSRLLPKHLKKQRCLRGVPQPQGAAGGSASAAVAAPGAAGRSICRDQTKNTAGRSFSSAAISRSLSYSSTARFKTPEGSALVSSFPTATAGKRQAESPRYLPGAPAWRLQGNFKS